MKYKIKPMIWILGVCLIAATVIVACEEVTVTEDIEKDGQKTLGPIATGAVATKWWEVDKQIEWITKGLTFVADDVSGFRKLVHEECEMNQFDEVKTGDAHTMADYNLNYDLQNGHEVFLDTKISGNTYDKLFFAGFEFGINEYENYIWIPEIDSMDTSNLHVFVPYRVSEEGSDTNTGFFLDTLGNLDSMLLDWENDPWKDYYIWIVAYEDQPLISGPIDPDRGNENPCGDGYCDPLTEDHISCDDDCDPINNPNGVKVPFQIRLVSIQVIEDKKDYMESWLKGKYDFRWSGCVYNDNNEILDAKGYNKQYTNDCFPYGVSNGSMVRKKVKRKKICRVNNNNKERGTCPGEIVTIDEIIVTDFREDDRLMLVCFENDNVTPFQVGITNLTWPNGVPLNLNINTKLEENKEAVNPFYARGNSRDHTFQLLDATTGNPKCPVTIQNFVDFNKTRDEITTNSFGNSAGTEIVLNSSYGNTEYEYTLRLETKQ
jgi:hypothetical protein